MTANFFDDEGQLVLHIIPSPRGRGAQRAARILVDRLNSPGRERHRLLSLLDGPPEVEVDLSLGEPGGGRPAAGFRPHIALRLRKLVSSLDPVAVVAHGGDAMKYAVPAVMGTGRPLAYCNIGTYAGPPARLHELMWRRIAARADIVVAVGNEVLQECTGRFNIDPDRVVMIPNGRDPQLYHPRPMVSSQPTTLMFVGALTSQKRPELFIEVVRRIRAEGYDFRAQIVGGGPLVTALTPLAATQCVELLGTRSDVPDLLRSADIFVFTSQPTGEGMPGVLIEAGLSGLPAVATAVPGVTAVLRDGITGLIVDGSAASVAAAVCRLLDDPDLRATMGSSARTWCVSEFNLDLMAERWRSVLQPVIVAQAGTARRGTLGLARRASARRRAMRSRRDSSQI